MEQKTIDAAKECLRVIKVYLNEHGCDDNANEAYWKLINFVNLLEIFEVKDESKRV